MAPLFVAFDNSKPSLRLAKMPSDVMRFLDSGIFVCSITGKHMRSVALHEMRVNKGLTTTIVHSIILYAQWF